LEPQQNEQPRVVEGNTLEKVQTAEEKEEEEAWTAGLREGEKEKAVGWMEEE
jgi:hypothetical protein